MLNYHIKMLKSHPNGSQEKWLISDVECFILNTLFTFFRYILHFDSGCWLAVLSCYLKRNVHKKQWTLTYRKCKNIICTPLSRLPSLCSGNGWMKIICCLFMIQCAVVKEHQWLLLSVHLDVIRLAEIIGLYKALMSTVHSLKMTHKPLKKELTCLSNG